MLFDGAHISFGLAFLAGSLTFVAPCVLPILPAYIGYISGVGLQSKQTEAVAWYRKRTFLNSLAFVIGFLFIFVLLGLTASSLGVWLNAYRRPLQILGGVLFIILGLHLAGFLNVQILARHAQFHLSNQLTRFQYVNSFLIGIVFGFGWTPCIGPILAVILFWASQSETFWKGFFLLLSFGLGLGVPFLILSLFTEPIMRRLRRMQKAFAYAQKIAGLLIVIIGIMLLGNWLGYLTAGLTKYGTLELWLY